MAKQDRHYINLGGTVGDVGAIKFGFKAQPFAYDGINNALGVVKVLDTNKAGIVYGVNSPRPVRVRISFTRGEGNVAGVGTSSGSVIRFCEPDKLNSVLFGSMGALKVKTQAGMATGHNINGVTIKGGS